jgi:hypothetical protein
MHDRRDRYWFVLVAALAVACGESSEPSDGESAPGAGGAPGGGSAGVGGASAGGAQGATDASNGMTGGGGPGGVNGSGGAIPGPDAGREGGVLGKAPFDWVGVIGTGQSLSTGCCDAVPLSTTQPFKNLKLADTGPDPKYPIDGMGMPVWSAIPLTEPIRPWLMGYGTCSYPPDNCQYPNNIFKTGETPHSGMANELSAMWRARGGDYITAHSVVGVGGALLIYIQKGTGSYKAGLSEAKAFTQLAKAAGKTYGVAGIVLTHGESDSGTVDYGAGIYKLWQDYNADLKAVTGQTRDVVLFASQQSSTPAKGDSSAVQLWRAGVDHPGQLVCIGPKYQYAHLDGLHMTGPGYVGLGEKHAEVFDLVVNQSVPWKPLGPNKVSRAGAVITIDLDVPNPPLAWDTHISASHQGDHTAWSKGRGFEVADGAGADVAIASVEIRGASVVLTLAQAPSAGTMLKLSYVTTADAQGFPKGTQLHGALRDSDDFVGYDAEKIQAQVTNGSPDIKGSAGAFVRRAGRDIVTATGLAAGTIAAAVNGDTITLSAPWTGATGMAELAFHHDLYNYCVQFSMAVP